MPEAREDENLLNANGDYESDYEDGQSTAEENDEDEETTAEDRVKQAELITKTGEVAVTNAKHVIHCLTIIGQVEGHYILPPQNKTTKYEHVMPALLAIEQDRSIEGLVIILNTVGGDVEAGLAIAELIAGMKTPTVSIVVGGGHSIGVPLAVSAKRSFIVPSATMTIHPVRMNGLVLGVPQTLSYFDKMQDRIVKFVTRNSNISEERFRKMLMQTEELVMDVGTVIEGEEAVKCGLIDHLGGLSDAIDSLYQLIEEGETRYPSATENSGGEGGKNLQRTLTTERGRPNGRGKGKPARAAEANNSEVKRGGKAARPAKTSAPMLPMPGKKRGRPPKGRPNEETGKGVER